MKPFSILIALACVTLAVALQVQSKAAPETPTKAAKSAVKMSIPKVESADLNGKAFVLPDDLGAPRTLLLVAFQRDHQDLIDSWVEGLKLQPTDKDWFELPVVGAMSPIRQKFLDGAMRGGIQGESKRSRVITLYTDAKKFVAPLGKTKTDTIYVAVVAKDGEVLALEEGRFDKKKAEAIKQLWRAKYTVALINFR